MQGQKTRLLSDNMHLLVSFSFHCERSAALCTAHNNVTCDNFQKSIIRAL